MLDAAAIKSAQTILADDLEPDDQPNMSAAMRLHLARVLLGRLLGHLGGPTA
jgi:carbon-monoxide dehydrogenase medium subunit